LEPGAGVQLPLASGFFVGEQKMSWIKFETSTSEKPEVWAMAQSLGIDADAVVGKLLRVWAWFDTQTVEGNAPSVTKALLDSKVCVSGFCQAMISVGWMIEDDGVICLPNFDRHNGKTAKNRALTSKRVAEHKASNAKVTQKVTQDFEKGNASSVTSALPREEKRREEAIIPPVSPKGERSSFRPESISFPSEIDTPEVRTAWQSWCQHRREIKKPITPTSAVKQLGQLAVAGPQRAVAMIEHTIAKGWQGLQEPDRKANGHPQPPTINDRLSNIRLEDYPQ